MAKIHVLLKKEELDRERLAEKTVIVLDVLFARRPSSRCSSMGRARSSRP